MKLTKQIANFAGAAAIALSAAAMDAQAGNMPPGHGNNPTPTPGCNGNPGCGGGHTPTPLPPTVINNQGGTGIGIGKGGMGGMGGAGGMGGVATSTSNAVSNSGVNINTPRMVGNAPMAVAFANGNCQTGIGVSAGTFVFTGGLSFTKTDYTCMDYQVATSLGIEGMRLGRNEVLLMSLATLNNLSNNIRMSTMQVADGYLRCGRRAMESNVILGTAIANGAPCPHGAPRIAHHYNRRVRAPRVVHTNDRYACAQTVQKHNACVIKYPNLAKH